MVVSSVTQEEQFLLAHHAYQILFTIVPSQAFVLTQPALRGRDASVLRAETQLIASPGPLTVGCESVRQPGFARFTCLRDRDGDGRFDEFVRLMAGIDYFIIPVQSRSLTLEWEPLASPASYRALDVRTEVDPIAMIIRYTRTNDRNYVDFCLQPRRRTASWGRRHLVDTCLKQEIVVADQDLPTTQSVYDFRVSVLSFDLSSKTVLLHVIRPPDGASIFFDY